MIGDSGIDLADIVLATARRTPGATAIVGPDRTLTYAELDALSNRFAHAFRARRVAVGDRVGIWLDKSSVAVAAMQGAIRIGAAYVPLDPLAPPARIQEIVADCDMRMVVTSPGHVALVEPSDGSVMSIDASAPDLLADVPAEPAQRVHRASEDLAYILYTSGSTGTPKGVCISHRNALAFIEWAGDEVQIRAEDRLSNHAPFHFDLSVFDLYAAFRAGASVHLVPASLAYAPDRLVDFVLDREITVWYSVPSALMLMMSPGGLLEHELALRAVVFAGEPFPIAHLRQLIEGHPTARYWNFYGPTETNVCTAYEVQQIPVDRSIPVPIGQASSGDTVWAVKDDGSRAGVDEVGELLVTGPTVMLGYWGREPHGDGPYATGDLVKLGADGNWNYVGRRDHMVKLRGHRIELGDVEAALASHHGVSDVAVVVTGSGLDARLVAFIEPKGPAPTLLDVKRHCAERLPRYMIPDAVRHVERLPRTRNGKIDRLELSARAGEAKKRVVT